MSPIKNALQLIALLSALSLFTGCESTDGGSSSGSAAVYYGVGFYDPWYYGDYHDHDDIVVVPPGDRHDWGARPENPIARPPDASSRRADADASSPRADASPRPAARSTPSIPSTPRPASFGGGGRR